MQDGLSFDAEAGSAVRHQSFALGRSDWMCMRKLTCSGMRKHRMRTFSTEIGLSALAELAFSAF